MTDGVPTFRFSRESRIRIDREGRFWHEDDPIEHVGLARALASWLALDAATGRYVLRNAMDWCFVTVDDAPLVVRAARLDAAGRIALDLSDGTTEPLDPPTLRLDADHVPYCDVHGRAMAARFSRTAAFALLEHAEGDAGHEQLVLPTGGFAVRRVARGEGAALAVGAPALVTLYTRERCHLCHVVHETLDDVSADTAFALEVVDIDRLPELRERYGSDVPVVAINGRRAFKYRMTAGDFRRKLARAMQLTPGETVDLEHDGA